MFNFKKWFLQENLQGPGGGPEPQPENLEKLALHQVQAGAGAFPSFENSPIQKKSTPASRYADGRFCKKFMKSDTDYKLKKK